MRFADNIAASNHIATAAKNFIFAVHFRMGFSIHQGQARQSRGEDGSVSFLENARCIRLTDTLAVSWRIALAAKEISVWVSSFERHLRFTKDELGSDA
jgi:hypothetical protein